MAGTGGLGMGRGEDRPGGELRRAWQVQGNRVPLQRGFGYRAGVFSWLRRGGKSDGDEEAALVGRARGGDEAAFEELVRRHEGEVYRLCRRMLGSREDALDAAQDTFVRVFRALPKFRGEASFRTWLYGIALNVCRNALASAPRRAAARSLPLDADPDGEDQPLVLPDGRGDPERSAYGRQLGEALERALARLSREHREVLLLRQMEALEYEEMAAVLGCRLGTVKSRLARARAALLAELKGVWP